MDKKLILKNYQDFIRGKWINDRVLFEKQIKDPTLINEFNINEVNQDKLYLDFYNTTLISIMNTIKDNFNVDNGSKNIDLNKQTEYLTNLTLKQNPLIGFLYEKIRVKNQNNKNIYVISNKMLDYLNTIPLPNNLKFSELKYTFEIPAVFLFEDAICYFDNQSFFEDHIYKAILFLCDPKTKIHQSMFPEYRKIPDEITAYKDLYTSKENANNYSYNIYYHAILASILLMNQKNFSKIYTEFNPKIEDFKEKISKNPSDKKLKKQLVVEKSIKFIDLDLSLNTSFSKSNTQANSNEDKKEVEPHWRSAHWHTYWTGKRDSEDRKKELKFLNTMWIGSIEKVNEDPIFKVIKK